MGLMAKARKKATGQETVREKVPCEIREFPRKLDEEIARKRLRQNQLTVMTGIHESRISRWLGDDGTPQWDQLLKLARALDVTMEYLSDDAIKEYTPALSDDDKAVLNAARLLPRGEAMRRLMLTGESEETQGFTVPSPRKRKTSSGD